MLQGEHFAILLTFIKLPFIIKTIVLSILSGRFTQVLLYIIAVPSNDLDLLQLPDLLTFQLSFMIKISVLSTFEWPFYTGFTVYYCSAQI